MKTTVEKPEKRQYKRYVLMSANRGTLIGVFSNVTVLTKEITKLSPFYIGGETHGAKYKRIIDSLNVCEYGSYITFKVENSPLDTLRVFPMIENVLYKYSQILISFDNEITAKQHE